MERLDYLDIFRFQAIFASRNRYFTEIKTVALRTVFFVPGESPQYIFSIKFNPFNRDGPDKSDIYFLPNQRILIESHHQLMRTLHYQLCAVIDLSFLKIKNSSVDSMSMFPALPFTKQDDLQTSIFGIKRVMQRRVLIK